MESFKNEKKKEDGIYWFEYDENSRSPDEYFWYIYEPPIDNKNGIKSSICIAVVYDEGTAIRIVKLLNGQSPGKHTPSVRSLSPSCI